MILTIVSIITISLILFILGIFIIYISSVGLNVEQMDSNNRAITIFMKYVKFILFMILPPISVLWVTNEMNMSIYTRRNEISIMKFLGATNSFVGWPFIFEGIFIGLIGAFLGDLLLYVMYKLLYVKVMEWELGLILVEPIYVIKKVLFLFIIVGICLTIIGDFIALRKVLKKEIYER